MNQDMMDSNKYTALGISATSLVIYMLTELLCASFLTESDVSTANSLTLHLTKF